MNKGSKKSAVTTKPSKTVGLDIGDRYSYYCVLNADAELMEEGRIRTTEEALRRHFADSQRRRIALETGTHSPWISRLLQDLGQEVIVANARKLESISASRTKNDRHDAEQLARLAHSDPKLLSPVRHRSPERQRDLNLIRARSVLVRGRTMIINAARGLVKSSGGRLPSCSSQSFEEKVKASLSAELADLVMPLLTQASSLSQQIKKMDQRIDQLRERYAEIGILRSAPGVGPLVAATYVLTLDHHQLLRQSRSAGALLGLRPGQSQSGDYDPQCCITKTGNSYLRSLLIQSAQYILSRFGPDSALRKWGLKLAASGGKRGKKRAVVAVARKLSVILHRMWRSGQRFLAFPQSAIAVAAVEA